MAVFPMANVLVKFFFRFTERNKPHQAPAKFDQMKTTAAGLLYQQSSQTW